MKYKQAIIVAILLPGLCFASFGDQFNSLLERFFTDPSPQEEEAIWSVEVIDEEILGTDLHSEIMREENELQNIESQLRHDEFQLAEISSERSIVEFQLHSLDSDLGIVQIQQEKYSQAVIKWRRELEVITRQKNLIEAELRNAQRENQKALQKKYIRSETTNIQGELSIWDWVFSDKTISQIIEKKRREKERGDKLYSKVTDLKTLQSDLKKEEQRVARIFLHVQDLEREHAKQQALLAQLADARSNVLARLEFSQGDLQEAVEMARERQAESTILLQNLRKDLGDRVESESPTVVERLSYPLHLSPRITAKFKDEDYKIAFGREHWGIDLWAPQGTPFYAPMKGVIKKVAQNGYGYSYIIVDHGEDLYTVYGHISASSVDAGQEVIRGEELGKTGGTPGTIGAGFFTTGAHLHMELFHKGKYVNPEDWLEL